MPTLMARGQENVFGGNYNLGLWEYADKITEIIFETEIYIPITIFKSWDVSVDQNEDVMAYIIDDGLGTNTYKLFIQANNDKIYANQDMSGWFGEMTYNPSIGNSKTFSKLTQIHNLPILNTSQVVNMKSLFGYAEELIEIDLSGFNTTNVTNMSAMFQNCKLLTSLDLSSFNTENVVNMGYMFNDCISLTDIDLRNAIFTKVMSYNFMFRNVTSGINIMVKDVDAQTWIKARSHANVTIA